MSNSSISQGRVALRGRGTQRRMALLGIVTILSLLVSLFPQVVGLPMPTASAHNLNASVVYVFFDADTQAKLDARILGNDLCFPSYAPPAPLLHGPGMCEDGVTPFAGDELGLVIKAVPDLGTTTGVGGYTTFYIPNGLQVVDAAFLQPSDVVPGDITGWDKIPAKGQARMPAVGAGGDSTVSLVGIKRGPNILGMISDIVADGTSSYSGNVFGANTNLGTLPGVYGDTGIFYSTAPETAFGTYSGGSITNNSGDEVGLRTVLHTTLNKWDAWQMAGYGIKGTTNPAYPGIALIDGSNQRGYAPWGLANVVAGPQSGYAWGFNFKTYSDCDPTPTTSPDAHCIDLATKAEGPWQRIKYPGSQFSDDPPGDRPAVQPYTRGANASNSGFDLTTNDLQPTTGQANGTPNAIRFAYGQLTYNVPEYSWVKVRVNNTTAILDETGCPKWTVDTFGGDAGGDSGGKDHIWRYYDPNSVTFNGCLAIGKPATRELVKVGETYQYKVKMYNMGNNDFSVVQIKDTLPSGVTYVSAVPAPSSVSLPYLTWNVSPFLRGQKFEATVTVTAKSSGLIANTVCATGAVTPPTDPPTIIDSCGGDTTLGGNLPLLSQTKSVSPTSAAPGESVTYQIRIKNIGTGPTGTPVLITDYLPTGFTYPGTIPGTLPATVNGASVSVSVSGTASQPVMTVSQAINAGGELVLSLPATIASTTTAGSYCNYFTSNQNGINLSTGTLACVTVSRASIGDTVYRDWNGNGAQEPGEEGIPGVEVCATGPSPSTTKTCALPTDANGKYLINGLQPGTYSVELTNPPGGYTPTQGAHPTSVTLQQGDNLTNVDFGYYPGGNGAIGDTVFEDIVNDGQFDPQQGDLGIPNVQVCLYVDRNNDGKLTPGTDLPVTGKGTTGADTNCVLTDANGVYHFTGLAEGINYLVNVATPQAALATHFGADSYQASTPDPQRVQNLTGTYDAADFGFFRVLPSSIGDTVFVDNNNNGVYDAGDTPIPNVTVELYRNGALFQTATTDANGKYLFDMLGPSDYAVKVVTTDPDIPTGYAPSVSQYDITLATSTNVLTADFPFVRRIQKQVDLTSAQAGNPLNYTINVQYPGSELLSNVVVIDTVPAGTVYADNASPTPAIEPLINATGNISWNLGSNVEARDGSVVPAVTLVAGQDTYIDEDKVTTNYGSSTTLEVNGDVSGTKRERPLIQFDLSSVCPGAIQSAQLVLVRQSGGGNADAQAVTVHRVTQSWNAATATWTSFGAAGYATAGSDPTVTVSGNSGDVAYTWNVTDIVKSWCQIATPNANDGFILTSALDNNKIHLFYSMEGAPGLTPKLKINGGGPEFGTPAHVTTSLGGNDALNPAVVYDSTGVAHTVFQGKVNTTDSKINIYYSNDQGTGTWTAPVRINTAEPPFDANDALYPRIAVDSGNNLHVVFETKGSADGKINVYAVKGTNTGLNWTWGTAANVSNNLGGNDSLLPDIIVDSTGVSHVVFEGKNAANGDSKINIYYSRDGGTGTWTTPVKLTGEPPFDANDALYPRITVGPGDGLHVAFESKATGDSKINVYYIKATKSGSIWSFGSAANVSKNLGGNDSTLPDIAVDSAGVAHIVFRGKSAANGDTKFNIYYANNKAGAWSTPKKVTPKPPFDTQDALDPEIAVDADGVLHVVFQEQTSFDSRKNVYYTTINNGSVGTATNISQDLGNQDAVTPDVAVSGTYVMAVFQGKTGADKDIFASSVPLAAPSGNLTNHLQASPTLAGNGATLTILQTLTADSVVNNITPGTLSFTGLNGASVTGCSPESLVSADDDLNGTAADSVVYKWTCTAVTTGITALPDASVTFKATASGNAGATAFAESKSNSVLETPPLKFRVTVNDPATVNPVVNTATVQDDGVIPPTSAKAQTAIGASIGDTVFADLDGNGFQGAGEPGLGGVQVCATDGVTPTCATTDGSGNYRIFGLDSTKNYLVSLNPLTVPAGYLPTTPSSKSVTSAQLVAAALYYSDADFGLRPPGGASIGDTVWNDGNANGVVDPGEPLLPNITVKLYDSTGSLLLTTTTTDANGKYQFAGLYAGNYVVKVDETSTVISPYDGNPYPLNPAMKLVSGKGGNIINPINPVVVAVPTNTSVVTDVDFGYQWKGTIGDYVWWDNNTNQLQDESPATPIAGATVLLYFDANGDGILQPSEYTALAFMDTGADGKYLFRNLPPGKYLVDVYEDSFTVGGVREALPTTPDVVSVTLGADQQYLNADFGYYDGALVQGTVWWDANRNGIIEAGEMLLQNITVSLICAGADGILDTGDDYTPPPGSKLTDAQGHYSFWAPQQLCRVSYTQADIQTNYPLLGLADTTTPISYTFTAQVGPDWHPTFDFGVDNSGKIGDTVWNDADGNGAQNGGELGLPGVTVTLYQDNDSSGTLTTGDTFQATMPTDANGKYLFPGLADGNYIVVVNPFTLPAGYTQTYDNNLGLDNTGSANIGGGNNVDTVDFGYKPPANAHSVSGTVWNDNGAGAGGIPADGIKNGTEPGIPVVTVCLYDSTGTTVVACTVTDANGNYIFPGTPNGITYVIKVDPTTLPSTAYYQTGDPDSTKDNKTTVTVSGGDVTNKNFGYRELLGSISGTVCSATDGDGICQSGGEIGLTPVTVTLIYAGTDGIMGTPDDVSASTTTATGGGYTFDGTTIGSGNCVYNNNIYASCPLDAGLVPGLYQVIETNPANYISLADRDGGNPDNISLVLALGQNQTGQDFEDTPVALPYDFGDAPDPTYPTLLASNGPRHVIVSGLSLGTATTDADNGTLQNVAADADDTSGLTPDDEDGVTMLPTITAATTSVPLSVSVFNNTGSAATLACWIDFNRDGDFLDAGERASTTVGSLVSQQTADLTFTGFATPTAGTSYLRCRVASNAAEVQDPIGSAASGEVEDYALAINAGVCGYSDIGSGFNGTSLPPGRYIWFNSHITSWSASNGDMLFFTGVRAVLTNYATGPGTSITIDLPDSMIIVDASVATRSTIWDGSHWVTTVPSTSGNPFLTGTVYQVPSGYDLKAADVVLSGTFVASNTQNVRWQWSAAAYTSFASTNDSSIRPTPVDGYFDPVANETFSQSGSPAGYHQAVTGGARGGGGSNYTGSNSGTGGAGACLALDYGDAPDTGQGTGTGNYNTTLSDNGPRHVIVNGLKLGSAATDADGGTLQNPAADADDTSGMTPGDEDGVTTLPTITAGSISVPLTVNATNTTGAAATLACWIDFNRNGVFEVGEWKWTSVPDGSNNAPFVLTFSGFGTPNPGDSYMRCRIASAVGEVTDPTGAANSGEVEDYKVVIKERETGVAFAGFTATAEGPTVSLAWETTSEAEIIGFNVLRMAEGGAFVLVNAEFIPATYAGQGAGATYTLRDDGLPAGAYTYRLEVVGLDGSPVLYLDAAAIVGG